MARSRPAAVLGLVLTVGSLACVAPPSACAALGTNLVVDGGGEGIAAHPTEQRVPPAWQGRGQFSVRAYGAAGGLIVLLLWVYYSAQIFLFGAEFTKIYANTHGSRRKRPVAG